MNRTQLNYIIFVFAVTFAVILQILTYLIEPLSESGIFLQQLYGGLFYIPLLLILITFPQPKSVRGQIVAINVLVICLVLASMNVDYQVLRIFSLGDTPPPDIGILVWDKTYNLYWLAWTLQMSVVFVIFGLVYRFVKNDTWTAVRIGVVGPLISLFSFEDILYYPMHGENPFNISGWSWLPQHNIYFGRPVNTVELIWIVCIAMSLIFVFLVGFALKKQPETDVKLQAFSTPHEKTVFLATVPMVIGGFLGFTLLYLNMNIIDNRIPVYLLLSFAGILVLFVVFSSYFPRIKSTFRQLVSIFGCYIFFWIAATEMDWNAVEEGFHWIVPADPRKPPGDFWIWGDYRMAMWLIYLPIIVLFISLMFKFLGNSRLNTLKLGITNFLILVMGLDSIVIFFILGFEFPSHWAWSNIYPLNLALPIIFIVILGLLALIWRSIKTEDK